jgi:two-component system cell cycle response regulator DivK
VTSSALVKGHLQAWQIHPDIIVTELLLPQCDGWDFIRELKGNPRTRDIPVVIVTSANQPGARERAVREGCAAFLVKPCMPDLLAADLRAVLNQIPTNDRAASSR